jgi:hypothetical protein
MKLSDEELEKLAFAYCEKKHYEAGSRNAMNHFFTFERAYRAAEAKAQERIDIAVKALEFYAQKELWEPKVIIPSGVEITEPIRIGIIEHFEFVEGDRGHQAREALAKIRGEL